MTRSDRRHYSRPRHGRPPLVRDDMAYILPMLTFLALTWVGATWKDLYVASYVAKTLVVAVMLYLFWPQYTPHALERLVAGRDRRRRRHLPVGRHAALAPGSWPGSSRVHVPARRRARRHREPLQARRGRLRPDESLRAPAALYAWYAVRIAGAVLVVPVMEELFWRDFLWRTIISPNDFKLARVGEWDWKAFVVVCVAFSFVHGNWWLTSIVWAAMVGWLLVYTKSLGACIVAHAVTNLLLAAYVLYSRDWAFW